MEYASSLFEPWLERHAHLCAVGFVPVAFALAHLWLKTTKLWKVFHMRKGDSFLRLEKPRKPPLHPHHTTDDDITPKERFDP